MILLVQLLFVIAVARTSSTSIHKAKIRDTLVESIPQGFVKWAESHGIFIEAEGIVSTAKRDTLCMVTELDLEITTEIHCENCESHGIFSSCPYEEKLLNLTRMYVEMEHNLIRQFSATASIKEFIGANNKLLNLVPYEEDPAPHHNKVSQSTDCAELARTMNSIVPRRRRKRVVVAVILGLVTLIALASAAVAVYAAVRVDDNTEAISGNHAAMSDTLDSSNDAFEDLKQIVGDHEKRIEDLEQSQEAMKLFISKEAPRLAMRGQEIKEAIKEAVFKNRIAPELISPHSLLNAIYRALPGEKFEAVLAFHNANPVSLMKSAKFYVTNIDIDSHAMKGLVCFPRVLPKTTFLAMKAVHQGTFDPLKMHFLHPRLASRFLVSMEDFERPLTDYSSVIKYWDASESCVIDSTVALTLCQPKHMTIRPEVGRCAIPPTESCHWDRLDVVGPFVRTTYIRGQAIVSTNQVSYDIVSTIDNEVIQRNINIISDTFALKVNPGQAAIIGGVTIYGQLSLSAPLKITATITSEDIHSAIKKTRPSAVQAKLDKDLKVLLDRSHHFQNLKQPTSGLFAGVWQKIQDWFSTNMIYILLVGVGLLVAVTCCCCLCCCLPSCCCYSCFGACCRCRSPSLPPSTSP